MVNKSQPMVRAEHLQSYNYRYQSVPGNQLFLLLLVELIGSSNYMIDTVSNLE
jgi:hypothetical protein